MGLHHHRVEVLHPLLHVRRHGVAGPQRQHVRDQALGKNTLRKFQSMQSSQLICFHLLLDILSHASAVFAETLGVDHAVEVCCGDAEGEGDVLRVAEHPHILHYVVPWGGMDEEGCRKEGGREAGRKVHQRVGREGKSGRCMEGGRISGMEGSLTVLLFLGSVRVDIILPCQLARGGAGCH